MQIATVPSAILALSLIVAIIAAALLARRLRVLRVASDTATRLRQSAQESEQTAMRRLRLAAHDLRGVGMSLHGHADHFVATGHPQADGIATAAVDLLGIADDLQDQTMAAGSERVLREEPIDIAGAVADAVAAVTASIGPGRRHWRITPDAGDIVLKGDRRALRHALSRVLADAVRNTRQDDWIDVDVQPRRGAVAIVIADEGVGLAHPEAGTPALHDSRGIGLRLSLARALVEAHGGHLEIEARQGVGTQVSLVFPAERRLPPEAAIVPGNPLQTVTASRFPG